MRLKNAMRKFGALLFGACVISGGGIAASFQTSYVYAFGLGDEVMSDGSVKTINGYVGKTTAPVSPNPGTGTPGTSFAIPSNTDKSSNTGGSGSGKSSDNKNDKDKDKSKNKDKDKDKDKDKGKSSNDKDGDKKDKNKSSSGSSGKDGDSGSSSSKDKSGSSGSSDTSEKKTYVEVSASMPDMSMGKTKKGHINKIAKKGIDLILEVFVVVGFVMVAASSGMLVFAFKDENADAKLRAAMGLATGVALVTIFTIFKTVGLLSKL